MCHLDDHRKFPAKVIGCVIWILMSLEAAKIPNESNQNPKPNYQVRGDPYVDKSPQRKSRNVPRLIATLLINRNMIKSQIQRVRGNPPVSRHESTKRCVLTPSHVENDQTGTKKPVTVDLKEEHKIDFRVPGLSHAVMELSELCETIPKVQCLTVFSR